MAKEMKVGVPTNAHGDVVVTEAEEIGNLKGEIATTAKSRGISLISMIGKGATLTPEVEEDIATQKHQRNFTKKRPRVQMPGIVSSTNPSRVEEVNTTIIIKEVMEEAAAIKEDEAMVATKEAVEEAEETEEAGATKVRAETTTNPTTRVTRTEVRMGDTIAPTIKVGVSTTITGKEMGATIKTGPARINGRETKGSLVTTLGRDNWRLHHPVDTFKTQELDGAVEMPSRWAPPKHTINYGKTTWN